MKTGLKKRVLPLLLSLAMGLTLLAGCTNTSEAQDAPDAGTSQGQESPDQPPEDTPEEAPENSEEPAPVQINVAALKGPTGMGVAQLMDAAEQGTTENKYNFTLESAPDAVVGLLTSGEIDAAALPLNLASTLYKKTEGKIQLASVNTLGVLYLLERGDSIASPEDLKGKTIYATGQGTTPEYVLNYILKENGLTVGEDVTVEYLEEHAALAASFIAGECDIALLPEPFVTQVLGKSEDARIALDLNTEWEKAAGDTLMTMSGFVVRKEFAEQNKEALDKFLKEYEASVQFITDEANLEEASKLIEKYDIMTADVAGKALPRCNIIFAAGEEAKTSAGNFLQVLFDANPKSVGGELPDDGFYYDYEG